MHSSIVTRTTKAIGPVSAAVHVSKQITAVSKAVGGRRSSRVLALALPRSPHTGVHTRDRGHTRSVSCGVARGFWPRLTPAAARRKAMDSGFQHDKRIIVFPVRAARLLTLETGSAC